MFSSSTCGSHLEKRVGNIRRTLFSLCILTRFGQLGSVKRSVDGGLGVLDTSGCNTGRDFCTDSGMFESTEAIVRGDGVCTPSSAKNRALLLRDMFPSVDNNVSTFVGSSVSGDDCPDLTTFLRVDATLDIGTARRMFRATGPMFVSCMCEVTR